MLKSIVVALDSSASSRKTQEMALALAKNSGARLVGMGVLDVAWITSPRATPIGASSYKEHRDQVLLDKGRQQIHDHVRAFRALCESQGVEHGAVGAEGVPHEQIEQEADMHDLIMVGRTTNFSGVEKPDIGKTVSQLLYDNPRPIIIVPEDSAGSKVVVAFDGSLGSSRAMHMFLLLGLVLDREVHIVTVKESQQEADALSGRAARLFRNHGVRTHVHGVASKAHPADVLLGELDGLDAGILVMGAFAHHGVVHEWFVGSATRRLLDACPVPIFVHH